MFFERESFLGPSHTIHLMRLQLRGAMVFSEKWNFYPWKISVAASLHGCGLTACHIPETDAPRVFGQTSFPSFEVESVWVRTLGQGGNLALDYVVGFLGESYRVAIFITTYPQHRSWPTLHSFSPLPTRLLVHWELKDLLTHFWLQMLQDFHLKSLMGSLNSNALWKENKVFCF